MCRLEGQIMTSPSISEKSPKLPLEQEAGSAGAAGRLELLPGLDGYEEPEP